VDRARRKAKEETARRAQVRKTKQRTDAEWKEQVLEKLGKMDELVVQVWRVTDVLERMAGMRSKTPEDDLISWPESGGEEMETGERMDKGKQREQSPDGAEDEEEVEEQEEENAMEGVEVVNFLRLRTLSELELHRIFFVIFLNKICVQHENLYFQRMSSTKICILEEWFDPYPPPLG